MEQANPIDFDELNPADIEALIPLALRGLQRMFVPSENLFCYSMLPGHHECQGTSLRYSMISVIGLAKARAAGYEIRFPVEDIMKVLFKRLHQMTPIGELGLFLWADALWESGYQGSIFDRVKPFSRQQLRNVQTMELAWILTGLSLSYEGGQSKEQRDYAQSVAEVLKACFHEKTGLFCYRYHPGFRRMVPNFASEIYPIYALSKYHAVFGDQRGLEIALKCAHHLCHLQGENGEWGWLYNAQHGTLIDRYAVYSVHQDGMAPMALFALADQTSVPFSDSIMKGLRWIYGQNELSLKMVNPKESLVYRSIYRPNPLVRYRNLFISLFGKTPSSPMQGGIKKVNDECRPYHLGWILEAWCGRTQQATGEPPARTR